MINSFLSIGWGGKGPVGRESFFFFFPNFIFYKIECTGGGGGIKIYENMEEKKKEFQSALFSPLERWTGNNFSIKGGPMT